MLERLPVLRLSAVKGMVMASAALARHSTAKAATAVFIAPFVTLFRPLEIRILESCHSAGDDDLWAQDFTQQLTECSSIVLAVRVRLTKVQVRSAEVQVGVRNNEACNRLAEPGRAAGRGACSWILTVRKQV